MKANEWIYNNKEYLQFHPYNTEQSHPLPTQHSHNKFTVQIDNKTNALSAMVKATGHKNVEETKKYNQIIQTNRVEML